MIKVNEPIEPINKITPLMYCASYGDENCMKVLVGAGADPKVRDMSGLTVLHYACKTQNAKVLQYICCASEFNGLINTRTNGGITPLMYAVRGNSLSFVA